LFALRSTDIADGMNKDAKAMTDASSSASSRLMEGWCDDELYDVSPCINILQGAQIGSETSLVAKSGNRKEYGNEVGGTDATWAISLP